MSEDFYRWQCHEQTQEVLLDIITNYHLSQILMPQQDILTSFKAMILVTTITQPPPPQVVLPPTARWLEPLHILRRSLKLETFSLLQVGTYFNIVFN